MVTEVAEQIPVERLIDAVTKHRVTAFIGRTDTGKSTLIRQIANQLNAYIVDSDIGQSDVGPPATVSLGETVDGSYRMLDGYFCGSTTPARHFLQLIAGTSRMILQVPDDRTVLINTTGLATGDVGRALKTEKLNAIRPDLIIALEAGEELKYLSAFEKTGTDVIFTKPSSLARQKGRLERMGARMAAFRAHFAGASIHNINIDRIGVERLLLNNGIRMDYPDRLDQMAGCELLYVEVSADEAIIVHKGTFLNPETIAELLCVKTLHACTPESFHGALVGLQGKTGKLLALGIIDNIDFRYGMINIISTANDASVIQFGTIRLNPTDFSYAGAFSPVTIRT